MSALRHRVAGVHDQIEQHLLELRPVGVHVAGVSAQIGDHGDVLADQTPQHSRHLEDHGVQINGSALQDLLAAEGKQLPGQAARALGGVHDGLGLLAPNAVALGMKEEQLGAGKDHGQHVVEVMGDATGQQPDGLHLLGLQELLGTLLDLSFEP